jgi:large subunit ribosomal protein L12
MEYIYAVLLLHKLGKPVDEHGIHNVMKAAGASVDEAKVKTLLASLAGVDINKELENATLMAAAHSSGAAQAEAPAEEKKEEVKAEAAAEGLSSLFG